MDNLLFNVGIGNLFTVFDLHEFACEWKEFVAPLRVTYVKMARFIPILGTSWVLKKAVFSYFFGFKQEASG